MTRKYSPLANEKAKLLLDTLANKSVDSEAYQKTMLNLGTHLGDAILAQIINPQCTVYLACTVEDADFLAKGILSRLEENLKSVAFACLSLGPARIAIAMLPSPRARNWNKRFSPFEIDDLKIAPILKKYQEPVEKKVNYLVVVKSIISGACVVRTNLNDLIQKVEPEKIFIAAPVIYYAAEEKFKSQFEKDIYDKFQFFYFAKDDERTSEGEVIPGIGGMVYDRLGFKGQDDKNSYVPELVKKRRSQLIAV